MTSLTNKTMKSITPNDGYAYNFVQDNAKSCPKCRSLISKIDGCNKMTCRHCQSYFCWLCNEQINGYEHFNSVDSQCYGRLFEGIETVMDYVFDNVMDNNMNNVMDDINQFFENLNI